MALSLSSAAKGCFCHIEHKDVSNQLQTISNFYIRNRPNLLRAMTSGYQKLLHRIDHSKNQQSSKLAQAESGYNELIDSRYKVIKEIGNGSFSIVFEANDEYTGRRVAMKQLKRGYHELGIREYFLLRQLANYQLRGTQYFLTCLDIIQHQDQCCLILNCVPGTLCDFIRIYNNCETALEASGMLPADTQSGNSFALVQPKAKRRKADGDDDISKSLQFNIASVSSAPTTSVLSSVITGSPFLKPSLNTESGISSASNVTLTLRQNIAIRIEMIRKIALRLVCALCVLRKEGLIHGDIKPENCFINWKCPTHVQTEHSQTYTGLNPAELSLPLNIKDHSFSEHKSSSVPSTSSTISASNSTSVPSRTQHCTETHTLNQLFNSSSNFDVYLGDFGNTIHNSEVALYYTDFELQSLPYRAPEVLLGLPFTAQIDMWSMGVVLLELFLGRSLFVVRSREELFQSINESFGPLPARRFAGGKFSSLLQSTSLSKSTMSNESLNSNRLLGHRSSASTPLAGSVAPSMPHPHRPSPQIALLQVNKILSTYHPEDGNNANGTASTGLNGFHGDSFALPEDFIHFIAGLLRVDPDHRLCPKTALLHPFLSPLVCVPLQLLPQPGEVTQNNSDSVTSKRKAHAAISLSKLRKSS